MEKKNLSTIITNFIYVYGMRMKGFLSALSYDKTLTLGPSEEKWKDGLRLVEMVGRNSGISTLFVSKCKVFIFLVSQRSSDYIISVVVKLFMM